MAFRKSAGSASKRAADIFSAASGHAKEKSKEPSILLKLFRGDIKLLLTFWTFCISLLTCSHASKLLSDHNKKGMALSTFLTMVL